MSSSRLKAMPSIPLSKRTSFLGAHPLEPADDGHAVSHLTHRAPVGDLFQPGPGRRRLDDRGQAPGRLLQRGRGLRSRGGITGPFLQVLQQPSPRIQLHLPVRAEEECRSRVEPGVHPDLDGNRFSGGGRERFPDPLDQGRVQRDLALERYLPGSSRRSASRNCGVGDRRDLLLQSAACQATPASRGTGAPVISSRLSRIAL